MSTIIQPKKDFVNSDPSTLDLSKKDANLQEKLSAELLETYRDINVVFFGTPEFAVPILEALCLSDFKPRAVITAPDKPVGRGQELTSSPIKIASQKFQIPVFEPKNKEELIAQTLNLKPNLIVVAAYGKILPKEILDAPKYGSVNVHPSLLPKYRGPSPIQFTILNGDSETGTTIMLMNERMDEGAILSQEVALINSDDTAESLSQRLATISAKLLIRTLGHWIILKEMPKGAQHLIYPQEQDSSQATYTKIIVKQDGKIFWDKSALELERQIRAFTPWPGSFTYFSTPEQKPLNLKILKASVLSLQTEKELGEIFITSDQKLAAQTGKDCLTIDELQLEGSKVMPATDFLNGHPEIIETILQ